MSTRKQQLALKLLEVRRLIMGIRKTFSVRFADGETHSETIYVGVVTFEQLIQEIEEEHGKRVIHFNWLHTPYKVG